MADEDAERDADAGTDKSQARLATTDSRRARMPLLVEGDPESAQRGPA